MTEIEKTKEKYVNPFEEDSASNAAAHLSLQIDRGSRMREWLDLFFDTAKAADVLAKTDFVPKTMVGKPAQVAAAMMKGYELGIEPLDALGNIFSVHGRIGFYAEFMRRRIIECGHEYRITETSDTRAAIEGRRSGEETWTKVTFTAQQAKTAGIDISSYPEDKLVARATSRLCKRLFPDVLTGSAIVEDLIEGDLGYADAVRIDDGDDEQVSAAPAPAALKRGKTTRKPPARAPRARKPVDPDAGPEAPALPDDEGVTEPAESVTPVAETEPQDAETVPIEAESAPEPASDSVAKPEPAQVSKPLPEPDPGVNEKGEQLSSLAQQRKLAVVLAKEGLAERSKKLDYLQGQFGRTFTSSKELTKAEASKLIDFLETAQAEDAAKGDGR
ncbi:hypothetical protein SAMN02799641_05733 [Rhodococcus erythropolis]|uniref:hypothetical protein n=1 Tax=Rhodococcus erythropolis TaxID=1833 RepID=UPI0008764CF5|nr:hypothetical protein [Rhodococcus erythropolis]SCZ14084.1 hypothetical protein SAMN02799641_05733 [Rhodococcus erythropolis]